MSNYEVGQILFMTSNKSISIIPVQVIEEVIRTTLAGQEKTHIIKFPDKKKTTADINHVNGKLFTSKNSLRSYMIKNAATAIDAMIKNAELLCNNAFAKELSENIVDQEDKTKKIKNVQSNINDDIITVDLGNGVKAKMKTKNLEKVVGQ